MITVLYVDDEPELLELGKTYLEQGSQFHVITAGSGAAALRIISSDTIDAIVSDYQMPEMSGIDLLREIRRQSDIPFILFTGRGREEVVISAINSGADFYLQKGGDPVAQFAELGHKIQQAVSRSRAERNLRSRLELIKQTSEVATQFIRLSGDEIDGALTGTLARLGEQYQADRCYLALVASTGRTVSITHEWTNARTRPVASDLGQIPLESIPWLARRIRALETISIPRIAALPESPAEIALEKRRLTQQEIRSLLLIPLTAGHTVLGAIGMDAVHAERAWPDADVDILKIYSQIIAGALARGNAERAIQESEELYRTVFESTGTAMMILEEDRTIAVVNREMERISGYLRDEIEGKLKWTVFVIPEDVERMKQYHIRRRSDPASVPKNYEFRFVSRDKRVIRTYITVEMIPGTKKSIVSLIDISREEQARQQLIDSEEKFRSLAESLLEGIYMIQDGRFIYVNPAFARIFGYTHDEVLALPEYSLVFAEEDRPRVRQAVMERLTGIRDAESYSVRGLRKDGRTLPVDIHGSTTQYKGRPAVIGTITEVRYR